MFDLLKQIGKQLSMLSKQFDNEEIDDACRQEPPRQYACGNENNEDAPDDKTNHDSSLLF